MKLAHALACLSIAFAARAPALCASTPAQAQNTPASAQGAQPAATGLDQIVERVDLRGIALGDALRLLSEESSVNLIASEEASSKVVSCLLLDVSVRAAIETIAKAYGLWYREDAGIVRVMTAKEFERDLSWFRDEQTAFFTLLYPNSLDVAYAIRNLFGDRVRLSLDREYMQDEYQEINQRFQRFDLLDRRTQSTGTFGGNTSITSQGLLQQSLNTLNNANYGNTQNQYQEPRPEDRRAGAERDALSSTQIESLQKSLSEQGGELDPALMRRLQGEQTSIYVSVIRRNNTVAVRSADKHALEEIQRLVTALDVPTPQVLLEIKILRLDLGDDFQSAFDVNFNDGTSSGRFRDGDIKLGTGLIDAGAFVYQYVNDNFQARIQFLQDRNRVSALATPLLLVANNEVARLFIGEERPLVRNISSQTIQNTGTTVTSPTTQIEIKPVGTTLLLTPNVNADRTVTLRVLQENSEINPGGASIPVINADGDVTDQPVDTVRSRTITGTVIAKDGLTLALGGLVEEGVQDVQSGIPGLMDLPLVGALFRRETKNRSHNELVVLVRPYVLFTAAEGMQMSKELAGKLSLHPSAPGLGEPLGTYGAQEAPRPPLNVDPLKDMLKFQSGLPDGR